MSLRFFIMLYKGLLTFAFGLFIMLCEGSDYNLLCDLFLGVVERG